MENQVSAAPPVRTADQGQLVEVTAVDLPRLASLFDSDYPNLAFVHAVIDGAIPGRAWAHFEGDTPVTCLIATTAPFCFAAGVLGPAFFTQAKALLTGHGEVQLAHLAGPETDAWAERAGFTPGRRIQLTNTQPGAGVAQLPVPDGYEMVRIDAGTFSGLESPMARSIFGTGDQYVAHAVGFALVKDGQVAADAHGVIGGGLIELGANTHPDHRRLGLASVVLTAVSRWGTEQGLRPVVSFLAGKAPSIALGASLGLTEELPYPIAAATC